VSNLTADQQAQVNVPPNLWNLACPDCGDGRLAPVLTTVDADEDEALAQVRTECDRTCGYQGATMTWPLAEDEYRNVFGHDFDDEEGEEAGLKPEDEDDGGCDCDDLTCQYEHPDGQNRYEDSYGERYPDRGWAVAELTDVMYGKWPESAPFTPGEMAIWDRITGEKWDALAFLAAHKDMQGRYLALGHHAFWPDEYPNPGLDYMPNPNWAEGR
jgi:hypothetical protein